MAYLSIRYDVREGIATVALNRPDALNSLTHEMKQELLDAFQAVERDDAVRAVILTGEGRGFCAGEALDEGLVQSGEPPGIGATLRKFYNPLIEKMRGIDKPIVAAVNGVAAGAGVSLALACDFRLASDKASFLQAFVKIGLVPDAGGTFFLPRLVGFAKAMELCMLGDRIDAAEAERIGLVNRVVPQAELAAETTKLAARLAASPTKAIGLMKRALQRSYRSALDDQLAYEADLQDIANATADFREGVTAFLEKRAAVFKGK